MARPYKDSLDYYPHVINMWDDDKFLDMREEMGLLGLGILTQLLDSVYAHSYYLQWNDTAERRFCLKWHASKENVRKAIAYLTGTNRPISREDVNQENYFFHRQLYLDDKVLTSIAIQKYYLSGCNRRKQININIKFFLLPILQETEQEKQERLDPDKRGNKTDKRLLYAVVSNKKLFLNVQAAGLIEQQESQKLVNAYNNSINVYNNPTQLDPKGVFTNRELQICKKYTKERKGKEIEIEIEIEKEKKLGFCINSDGVSQNTFSHNSETIESLRQTWNSLGLPVCRLLPINFPNIEACLDHMRFYSQNEIEKAMHNYADIRSKPEQYNLLPSYPYLHSFLCKGIQAYADDAQPYQRCQKDSTLFNSNEIEDDFDTEF